METLQLVALGTVSCIKSLDEYLILTITFLDKPGLLKVEQSAAFISKVKTPFIFHDAAHCSGYFLGFCLEAPDLTGPTTF